MQIVKKFSLLFFMFLVNPCFTLAMQDATSSDEEDCVARQNYEVPHHLGHVPTNSLEQRLFWYSVGVLGDGVDALPEMGLTDLLHRGVRSSFNHFGTDLNDAPHTVIQAAEWGSRIAAFTALQKSRQQALPGSADPHFDEHERALSESAAACMFWAGVKDCSKYFGLTSRIANLLQKASPYLKADRFSPKVRFGGLLLLNLLGDSVGEAFMQDFMVRPISHEMFGPRFKHDDNPQLCLSWPIMRFKKSTVGARLIAAWGVVKSGEIVSKDWWQSNMQTCARVMKKYKRTASRGLRNNFFTRLFARLFCKQQEDMISFAE